MYTFNTYEELIDCKKKLHHLYLSVKPSCELCELSVKIIQLYDPIGDISECLSCGFPTQFVFCTQCIDEIHN